MPWQAAQDFCRDGSKMGNLISIHDGNTNAVAAEVAENDNWIGLTINAKDDYRWVDDSSFDYSSWKDGGSSYF